MKVRNGLGHVRSGEMDRMITMEHESKTARPQLWVGWVGVQLQLPQEWEQLVG